jgi:lipase
VICLHGVNAHAGRFAGLAGRLGDAYRVVAVDLRGHGRSTWEPPWDLGTHLDDLHDTLYALGLEEADWIGHSFGGRLLLELIADRPGVVHRAVLLDPAVWVPPHIAFARAEAARHERSYATPEEAVERRYAESALRGTPREIVDEEAAVHLEQGEDGRWRYRYCQAAVVTAFSEMAKPPPPFDTVLMPMLVVRGAESDVVPEVVVDILRDGIADLQIEVVPGGHIVMWEALEETASAVERFLASRVT